MFIRFGPYLLDTATRILSCGGTVRRLSEKLFNVLMLLVDADGRTVEREDFFRTVWSGEFPSDATLTQHIFMLRRLFEVAGEHRPAILTVSRKGYRMALPIERKTGLMMKRSCERCRKPIPIDGTAFICSYECTYCASCTALLHERCMNCGGKLVVRPPRANPAALIAV